MKNWKFTGEQPTAESTTELLKDLDPIFGINVMEVADYIQPLPQNKKVKVEKEVKGRVVEVTEYIEEWTLYMSVGGRVKMIQLAAEENNWRVDFVPEKKTPTGVPGWISLDVEMIYQEHCVIYKINDDGTETKLGSKVGTSRASRADGGAAGSNPHEKAQTSARGRAIAGWGFGVLPGSGIASLEEMMNQTPGRNNDEQQPKDDKPLDREEVEAELRELIEEARQATSSTHEEMLTGIAKWAHSSFSLDIVDERDDTGAVTSITFDKAKPGQLKLLVNGMQDRLAEIKGAE